MPRFYTFALPPRTRIPFCGGLRGLCFDAYRADQAHGLAYGPYETHGRVVDKDTYARIEGVCLYCGAKLARWSTRETARALARLS